MMNLRGIFHSFLLTLIFAVGANSVVMASGTVMGQEHCLQTGAEDAQTGHAHADNTDHDESTGNSASDHDHETCMMHACSAIAYEAHGPVEMPLTLSVVLSADAHEFIKFENRDSLLRPPNT
jgi:ABC-type Zn2+ transport system substrate-binding protein/surface adhesin